MLAAWLLHLDALSRAKPLLRSGTSLKADRGNTKARGTLRFCHSLDVEWRDTFEAVVCAQTHPQDGPSSHDTKAFPTVRERESYSEGRLPKQHFLAVRAE